MVDVLVRDCCLCREGEAEGNNGAEDGDEGCDFGEVGRYVCFLGRVGGIRIVFVGGELDWGACRGGY